MKRVKCYMVRHQAEGIIPSVVFMKPPTAEQAAAVLDANDVHKRHGKAHPKTKEAWFTRTHDAVIEVPDEIAHLFDPAPDPEPKAEEGAGEPGAGRVAISSPKVSGVGTVTPPGRETMTIGPGDVGTLDLSKLDPPK